MGTNILGIGQSALAAAQAGIATTGHNIANAATPGYNRQLLLQSAAAAQPDGGSFIGQGTVIGAVTRVYNEFLSQQVNTIQSSQSYSGTYFSQIQQINNLVSDPSAGVSPTLQDFFSSLQNLALTPNGTAGAASRQSVLSSANVLTTRMQSLQGRLDQIGQDVSGRITDAVININQYANQVAELNTLIEKAQSSSGGGVPNDLLDQREYAVNQLSKFVNVSVVKQEGRFNVFMGNGQALVLGDKVNQLQMTVSQVDPSRSQVAYVNNGSLVTLNETDFGAGSLGGLFAFRSQVLDVAQNSLGRIAIGIATSFNEQQQLGQDLNGQLGQNFFRVGAPTSTPSTNNTSQADIAASIVDVGNLRLSDYRVQYVADPTPGPNYYKITRLSDGNAITSTTLPMKYDGVSFNLSSATTPNVGDEFLIKPTAAAVGGLEVAIKDVAKIAAAAPITGNVPTTNTGTGKLSSTEVNSLVGARSNATQATISPVVTDDSFQANASALPLTLTFATTPDRLTGFAAGTIVTVTNGASTTSYTAPATVPYTSGATVSFNGMSFSIKDGATPPLAGETFTLAKSLPITPITLTYNAGTNSFSGFPATANVTLTNPATNAKTTYPAGSAIPYVEGAKLSYDGVSLVMSGNFKNGDIVNVTANTNGSGDNRNMVLMGALQTQKGLAGNSTSFQGAYSQFVSLVGNKTREVKVGNESDTKLLSSAIEAQQAESGVNLDEEATNLLRYQQAYQAAGKLMQIASQLFDALLALGR
jgi:flagellar hook-associated protein 1 FlgK